MSKSKLNNRARVILSERKKGKKLQRIVRVLGLAIKFGDARSYERGVITLEANIAPEQWLFEPDSFHNVWARMLAHEIGHYVVAPPSRRRRKNYGIVQPKFIDGEWVNTKYWDIEDEKASLVEYALVKACGIWAADPHKAPRRKQWALNLADKWFKQEGKQLVDSLLSSAEI